MGVIVVNMSKNKIEDKVKGILYGAAIGDALGATTEFMSQGQIAHAYPNGIADLVGGGAFGWQPGEVTDDTQMAMCIMEAVMESTYNRKIVRATFLNRCQKKFVEWYNSGPKDIGGACASGIRRIKEGLAPKDSPEALGNGSLMRAWPLAIIGEKQCNEMQGDLTHCNATCRSIISMYTDCIQQLMYGGQLQIEVTTLMAPTGCVINTFNNALFYVLNAANSEEGILAPVHDGGDTDTIACVTGSLLGAKFGYESIPVRWIEQLDPKVKEILDKYYDWVCENIF